MPCPGEPFPRGHRHRPGVPRPARGRLLAAVQHRVPGSLSGRHELPRLPEPRRRGSLRGGLHPLARAQPGRGDVRVRLLGPVRAGLPPRRHRPAARDPRHEALPRRVARGQRASPTRCRSSRRATRPSRSSAPGRRASSVARELAVAGHQVTVFDELPYAGGTMLIGVPAFRLPREAIEMDIAPRRAARRHVPLRHAHRPRHHVRAAPGALRRDRHLRGRHGPGAARRARQRPRRHPVRRRLHEGRPTSASRSRSARTSSSSAAATPRWTARARACATAPSNVTIAYRRTRSELVVDEEELGETEREGVRMEFLVSPVEVIGDGEGNVAGVRFIRNRLGEPDATGRRAPDPDRGLGVRGPRPDRHPGGQPGRRQHVPAGRVAASRSTAAASASTPARTPPTSAACSPAATS